MTDDMNVVQVIGDWRGSIYGGNGRRYDYHLFLDHDGRYERAVCWEPDGERRDTGCWQYQDGEKVLQLNSDMDNESDRMSSSWRVLSVATCETSNVLLVLREIVLASRNLPILFYRVHNNGRGYGTNWEKRLHPGDDAPRRHS
jgi:hypothetical protein